jgi:hypothetical protein
MRKLRNNYEEIPLREPRVTMIIITGDTTMFACSEQEKKSLVDFYFDLPGPIRKRTQVLAVWPGKTRSDVFNLDEKKLTEFKHEVKAVSRTSVPD